MISELLVLTASHETEGAAEKLAEIKRFAGESERRLKDVFDMFEFSAILPCYAR